MIQNEPVMSRCVVMCVGTAAGLTFDNAVSDGDFRTHCKHKKAVLSRSSQGWQGSSSIFSPDEKQHYNQVSIFIKLLLKQVSLRYDA